VMFIFFSCERHRVGCVMVSVLASSAVDREFEPITIYFLRKLTPIEIKLVLPRLKFVLPRLKLELSRIKLVLPRLKLELSRIKLVSRLFRIIYRESFSLNKNKLCYILLCGRRGRDIDL
jgi:hypothetical protein